MISRPDSDPPRSGRPAPEAASDSSGRAESADRWLEMLHESEDGRLTRIAALRRDIESGTYHVTGEAVADAILRFFNRSTS